MNYLLDIETLLQVMQDYRITNAHLYTTLTMRNSSYQANLLVRAGAIVSCTVSESNGRPLYQGKDAFQLLQGYGVADWNIVLEIPEPQSLAPAQQTALRIPYRRVASIPQQLRLTRLHTRVFALIDGQRDVERIAQMLPRSATRQDVEKALRDLKNLQIIDFN